MSETSSHRTEPGRLKIWKPHWYALIRRRFLTDAQRRMRVHTYREMKTRRVMLHGVIGWSLVGSIETITIIMAKRNWKLKNETFGWSVWCLATARFPTNTCYRCIAVFPSCRPWPNRRQRFVAGNEREQLRSENKTTFRQLCAYKYI